MTALLDIIFFAVEGISLLITFPGYMFILVVNILDWMKNKRLDISDQLISGISLFTFLHRLFDVSLEYLVDTQGFYTVICTLWSNLFYLSLTFCTLLFSTWLAIHFCLKIVNINHKLYIYIQCMFPKMFPWILLPSVFASVLISVPAALRLSRIQFLNLTVAAQNTDHLSLELIHDFTPYNAFASLCFLLFFSSALNIILSLHRHIKQIHNNSTGFRSQIVDVHITAMKTVVILLAFNLIYFALILSNTCFRFSDLWIQVLTIFYALCHILGVLILIRGSRKLQKKLHTIWLNCFKLRH